MADLFGDAAPKTSIPLTGVEQAILADLPDYGVTAVERADTAAVRRLERRGLVKTHQWRDDPASSLTTLYAGRTDAGKQALLDGGYMPLGDGHG